MLAAGSDADEISNSETDLVAPKDVFIYVYDKIYLGINITKYYLSCQMSFQ